MVAAMPKSDPLIYTTYQDSESPCLAYKCPQCGLKQKFSIHINNLKCQRCSSKINKANKIAPVKGTRLRKPKP